MLRDEIDLAVVAEPPSRIEQGRPEHADHWRQELDSETTAKGHCRRFQAGTVKYPPVANRAAECLQRYDGGRDRVQEEWKSITDEARLVVQLLAEPGVEHR